MNSASRESNRLEDKATSASASPHKRFTYLAQRGSSPFFAGFRKAYYCLPKPPPFFRGENQESTPTKSGKSRSGRESHSSRETSPRRRSRSQEQEGSLASQAPPTPTRVSRPPEWWLSRRHQPSKADSANPPASSTTLKPPQALAPGGFALDKPPPVPPRSPLRPVGLPSPRRLVANTKLPPLRFHLKEEKALWDALSPPPLRLQNSPRNKSTPPQARAPLLSPPPELRPAKSEGNLEKSPPEVVLGPEVIAHRQKTLEILESGPQVEETPAQLRRVDPSTKRPEITLQGCRDAIYIMNGLHPESAAAMTAHRREAVRLAQQQQLAVSEKCKRSKQPEPDYSFDELIGKGSFGRVYKGRQNSTAKVVAIKVLDVDEADFHAFGDMKDEQIRDFNREIRILRQAQDSGAENLNQMIEAFAVHSQLWLVCEYCPGGSVKTLMRATNDKLAEKYIIIVARELAKALKGLHEAGIMHRDVKAANVLIHQEGRLELCDFGVATILDTQTDKRKTFIGTLHWMPPELWTENPEYSDEVDVWEYGCTIYECALGRPPNADLRERQQLKMRMRRMKQALTLPENEDFSDELRSLVSYTLTPDAATRPSMKDVLQHDLLKDTENTHPTNMLIELVETYYAWILQGGQRVSLFMPGGAAAASTGDSDADIDADDEWNFSMTQDFERRVSAIMDLPDFSNLTPDDRMEGEETPKGLNVSDDLSPPTQMTAAQKANFEARVKRGADLSNLFDQTRPAYEYKTKTDFIPIPEQRRISDLPFRAMAEDRPSSIASNVIDLGDFDEEDYAAAAPRPDEKIQTAYAAPPMREETIRLADASTLREKRANSKGPRDPNNQSLTARRASSAEEVPRRSTPAQEDYDISQQDWTVKNRSKAPELQEPAEITSSRPGHATMDWSFASAMSEAAVSVPQINIPDEVAEQPSPQQSRAGDDGPGLSSDEISQQQQQQPSMEQKARKHATMEWSFSSAMAEAKAAEDDEQPQTQFETIQETSPPAPVPVTHQKPMPASRPTPTRPAPLMRQMTMPVTFDDFSAAEEDHDIPRPSTALSEAYSDVSASSTDVDPFGLERDRDDDDDAQDHPGPATMDEDVDMGAFYASRGRSLFSASGGATSAMHTPLTAASVGTFASAGPYAFGRPPRIGDADFPGSGLSSNAAHRASNSSVTSNVTAVPLASARSPIVAFVPVANPPSSAAMAAGANNEDVEAELTRLLEGMQGSLNAAREVVGRLEGRRRSTRGDDDDEDEEDGERDRDRERDQGREWVSEEDEEEE